MRVPASRRLVASRPRGPIGRGNRLKIGVLWVRVPPGVPFAVFIDEAAARDAYTVPRVDAALRCAHNGAFPTRGCLVRH